MKQIVQPLKGRSVVITAGPTQEGIDPVRFISNYSSGKMGFSLADAASALGAKVSLVAGPVTLVTPEGVERIDVVTAEDMLNACLELLPCDIFISAAAVADYRPKDVAPQKIKKDPGSEMGLTLELVRNPDIVKIIANAPNRPFTVGFAAETEDLIGNAIRKIASKNLDIIVLNDVANKQIAMGSDFNAVTIIDRELKQLKLAKAKKINIAGDIMRVITCALVSRN